MNITPRRGAAPLLLSMALLAGCSVSEVFDRDPEVSDVALTPATMPEVARVQVPMPPPEPPRKRERAEAASLWGGGGSDGFFADQRVTS